jgi:hypothetical protein
VVPELSFYALSTWTLLLVVLTAGVAYEYAERERKLKNQKRYQVHALLRAMRGVIITPGESKDIDTKLSHLRQAEERWGVNDPEVVEARQVLKQLDIHRLRYGIMDLDNQTSQWLDNNRVLIEHIVNESEQIDVLMEQLPELFEL